jgi:hypothetical protein
MQKKLILFIFLIMIYGCINKKSSLEICFHSVSKVIDNDSIIAKLKYSNIDSYMVFAYIINNAVKSVSKNDSICTISVNDFFNSNRNNSITLNNLILFQYYQSYLKKEKFDFDLAKKNAFKYHPEKMKLFLIHPNRTP